MRFSLTVLLLAVCACSSPPPERKPVAAAPVPPPKILTFYARDPVVIEGGNTVLCYGVSDAHTVRIDPPVEAVWPAMSHCIDVHPKATTTYTLTAEAPDGKAVTQAVTIRIGPDTASLPSITYFKIAGTEKDYAGKTIFKLSFADQNADEVSIDPPAFPTLHGSPSGEFYVTPDKTTTYTLTVTGKHGHAVHQPLTVEVPAGK